MLKNIKFQKKPRKNFQNFRNSKNDLKRCQICQFTEKYQKIPVSDSLYVQNLRCSRATLDEINKNYVILVSNKPYKILRTGVEFFPIQ